MQLYHFTRAPNFGDALNPWLWPALLGERLQPRSPTLFCGIGTLLNAEDLPPADRYAVLSSGGGYGPFPLPDDRWQVYAVRGPLTLAAMGLPAETATLDGAYLLQDAALPAPATHLGHRIAFMPHWQTQLRIPWKRICDAAGLAYLAPDRPVEETLSQLQACDGIIAEAMHGAITADALRIPWLPVRLGRQFLDFKWRDWLGSLDLAVTPIELPEPHPVIAWHKNEGRLRSGYRHAVNAAANLIQTRTLVARLRELRVRFERDRSTGHLSDDRVLNLRLSQLRRALDRVRAVET